VGAALTGTMGGGGHSEADSQQVAAPAQSQPVGAPPGGARGGLLEDANSVCRFELKQFVECSQTQYDLSLCQGFSEALKECQRANGMLQVLLSFVTLLKTCRY